MMKYLEMNIKSKTCCAQYAHMFVNNYQQHPNKYVCHSKHIIIHELTTNCIIRHKAPLIAINAL